MKRVTITALVGDETNQNELKTWLKSCPYSLEGGQTIAWENLPNPAAPAAEETKHTEETEAK